MFLKLFYKYYEKNNNNLISKIVCKLFIRGEKKKQQWLKLCGMKIGKGTQITCSLDSFQEPYMIELGNTIYVAAGVTFMTHDGSLSWLTRALGYTDKRTDRMGKIIVKDNCFIGAKSTIMQKVTIGENCIIGMGAVVTKDVPDNSVVAGVPARVICTTEEYLEKYKDCKDYTGGWKYGEKRKYFEAKMRTSNSNIEV